MNSDLVSCEPSQALYLNNPKKEAGDARIEISVPEISLLVFRTIIDYCSHKFHFILQKLYSNIT